jgi:GAF domain-containing protein
VTKTIEAETDGQRLQQQLELLIAFAGETLQQEADSRTQVERLTLLNQVMLAMSQNEDPMEAALRALELILSALSGIDMASAWLVSDDRDQLICLATSGYPDDGFQSDSLPIDAPAVVCAVALAGRSQVTQLPVSSLPQLTQRFVSANRIQTMIHIPMLAGQRVLGVLTFASRLRRDVDQEEVAFLETLSGQVGGSLKALSVHREQDAERRRLETQRILPAAIVRTRVSLASASNNQAFASA